MRDPLKIDRKNIQGKNKEFCVIYYGVGVCKIDGRIKHADQLERNKTSRDGF